MISGDGSQKSGGRIKKITQIGVSKRRVGSSDEVRFTYAEDYENGVILSEASRRLAKSKDLTTVLCKGMMG